MPDAPPPLLRGGRAPRAPIAAPSPRNYVPLSNQSGEAPDWAHEACALPGVLSETAGR